MRLTRAKQVLLAMAGVLVALLLLFPPRKDRPTLTLVLQVVGLVVIAALLVTLTRRSPARKQGPDKKE